MLSLSFQVRHVWGEPNEDMRPRDLAVFANQPGTYLGVFGFQNDWFETVSLDAGGFDIDAEAIVANAPDITLNFGTQSVTASGAPISWASDGLNSTDLSHANYAANYIVSQSGDSLSGGDGHDILLGGGGRDILEGNPGNDSIFDTNGGAKCRAVSGMIFCWL